MAATKITARYTVRVTGEDAITPEGEPREMHSDDLNTVVLISRYSAFPCEIIDNETGEIIPS